MLLKLALPSLQRAGRKMREAVREVEDPCVGLCRAERQVAAVEEVLGWHQPLYGDEARELHEAIRRALEVE